MGDIKQKACYRPNFKSWKDPSKETKKQEIWHTHPENLKLLDLKDMTLVMTLIDIVCLFQVVISQGKRKGAYRREYPFERRWWA